MDILRSAKDLPQFLHLVSCQKNNFAQWSYFHIDFSECDNTNIEDFVTYISVKVDSEDAALIHFPETRDIIVFLPNDNRSDVAEFDRNLHNNKSFERINTVLGSMTVNNHAEFGRIVGKTIQSKNVASQIALKRILSRSNKVMILDDDEIVTKQAQMALQDIADVYPLNTTDHFIEEYISYAPDILFLDIHLKTARGTEFIDKLLGTIDPYAHIIMISSDTMKKTIMDLRFAGTKGFIVKPFNREQLHQHVKRTLTYIDV